MSMNEKIIPFFIDFQADKLPLIEINVILIPIKGL